MSFSRRSFLSNAALGSIALGLDAQTKKIDNTPAEHDIEPPRVTGKTVIITRHIGFEVMNKAYAFLQNGGDTLDAAIMVGKDREDDPTDDTVGLGGLPNEDGVVELDSSCMHGPTRRAGAVGAVRNIKNVSLLAKAVMEHTGHLMLVGQGAERFGEVMGFPKENLLTENARKTWQLWKETHSSQDWWGPGLSDPNYKVPGNTAPPTPAPSAEIHQRRLDWLEQRAAVLGIPANLRAHAIDRVLHPPTGTIHVSVLNAKGEMSGMTTTSGWAWKLAGRVGDSPIIGAGCYCDQDIGSAGATGSGEENIKIAGAHTIVENMRRGMSPREAGLDALRRIVRNYQDAPEKLRYIDMIYYILRRDGEYAGVSLWSGSPDKPNRFVVHDGTPRFENTVSLYQGAPLDYPPTPRGTWYH